MKKLFILLLCLSVFQLKAQTNEGYQQVINFDNILHEFGDIKEEGGEVEHKFFFTNNSTKPIKVDSAKASCGCTTPEWSKEVIPVGGRGYVVAKYNPMGRPDGFTKTITVFFNLPEQPQVVLVIRGNVIPRPKTIADTLYTKIGGIRVLYQTFNFGEITNDKAITKEFDVYNDSEKPITFLESNQHLPEHLKIAFNPMTLNPRNRGKIYLTYDPKMKNDLGYVFDAFNFRTDEATDDVKQVYAVATIKEYFPPMSAEELANAPKLIIERPIAELGDVKQNERTYQEFIIRNDGKTPLNIRYAKASCGCTASQPDKSDLAPGETSRIMVTYTGTGEGRQEKTVTVFSNDPVNPTQVITIKVNVLKVQ